MIRAETPQPHEAPGAEPLTSAPVSTTTSSAKKVWLTVGAVSLLAVGAAGLGLWQLQKPEQAAAETGPKPPIVRLTEARTGSIPLVGSYRGELVTEAAELAARSSGRLLSVRGQIGDTFSKGALLAQIDALEPERQLAEAKAQVQSAEATEQRVQAQIAAARTEHERGKQLRAEALVSDQELTALAAQVDVLKAELASARAQQASAQARVKLFRDQIADARLVAPFDGAIAERYLDPGSSVQPNTPVLRLVRRGPLRVRFRVPERDLRHLRPGSSIELSTQATGSRTFPGKLERVSAEVSRTDRTLAAEGLLAEEYEVLRPGMYANVRLTFGTLEEVTLVPSAALSERITGAGLRETALFVIEDGTAHRKVITLLGQHGSDAAVEGVAEGDAIVSFGHEAVRDGGPVRLARENAP